MGVKKLAAKDTWGKNLSEVAARTTLREAGLKGHVYVELRKVGKRTIFFCVLCQAPCFNETVLYDHLNGSPHSQRYAAAKLTLLGLSPWPFSDGVLFFSTSCKNGVNGHEVISNSSKGNNFANGSKKSQVATNGQDKVLKHNGKGNGLVISGVLQEDEVKNLRVQFIGYGHIASRVQETNEGRRNINKIWCAWLGEGASDECGELLSSPKGDFAIVSFSYTIDLGRKATLQKIEDPRSPGASFEIDDLNRPRKKRKKRSSNPEDSSEALRPLPDSTKKRSSNPEDSPGASRPLPDSTKKRPSEPADSSGTSTPLPDSLPTSSRSIVRKELRKKKSMTAERACDICGQLMLLGKDVSTLLNCKSGKLACSSRNINGAFHLFHTSCLIHWILFCGYETWSSYPTNVKVNTRGRKAKVAQKKCVPIFCPECQGTGININGSELENPTVPLSEMFLHKLKVIEAQKTWMKDPEILMQCSTGLHFTSDSSEKPHVQEKVMPLKLLRFYRADE